MTDTTPNGPDADAPADATAPAAAVEPDAAPRAIEAPAAERPPFWQRPYVERYLVPLILPIAVVVGVVMYILNISRIFLSAPGHVTVVLGTFITVTILLGAALLALGSRLRSGSVVLVTVGFIAVIMAAGSINLGHSEAKGEAGGSTLSCDTAAKTSLPFIAGPNGALSFQPSDANASTGLVKIDVTDGSATEHTFTFDDVAKTKFQEIKVSGSQKNQACVAFFPDAGDYTFYCSIPGHRAAGMEGTIHVTGASVTLDAAEAAAGGGSSGGGETATTAAP
jgi:uncharacterized cupredoxin-like copper-binding protein